MFDLATVELLLALTGVVLLGGIGTWLILRSREVPGTSPRPPLEAGERVRWHALDLQAVFSRLEVPREGLSTEEAEKRLARHGPNRLPEAKRRGPLTRFLAQFHNLLIYVLLIAGVVTALLHHWLDSGVIFGVVVVNALIGFIQEGKAENALLAIKQMLSPKALVSRDGHRVTVEAEKLVPGDLVALQAGDKVPADLRLVEVKGLQIEEAVLTGESVAVNKATAPVAADTALGDRACLAFSGTLVASGYGLGVVVETGAHTEIGRISTLVAGVQELTTPLLRQMGQFGHWLTGAILGLAALNFAFGVLIRDFTTTEMFMASVGLAVAAIPEGLPAIITITLAIGVQRMAGRNAIIRRLPAVETLGTVAVICSDKTGTLTRNEMTVRALLLADQELEISGTGYDPHGGFEIQGREYRVAAGDLSARVLQGAVLCNDAALERREDGTWFAQGDPMEAALIVAAIKGGLEPEAEQKTCPRTDLIPFDSEYKFMATLHHTHDHGEQGTIFVKGAPEQILAMCDRVRAPDGEQALDRAVWLARMEDLAARGYRVLAIAEKPAPANQVELNFSDVKDDLCLLGLFGLIDPPREEAIEAAAVCHEAGIRVKMITGDHAITARAIAAQVGLLRGDEVLTGQDIDALDDAALAERVENVDVYARVSPEHKLRLVKALQSRGRVVAMTGDGINDAPALKRADVGVAMGASGTEAAKEAAEMVLHDDNFASIVRAVEEGRTVYDNLKKAILFILPTNGGQALIILGAILLGFHQMPLEPVQILWVNMVTAVTLALALAFEPPEPNIMRRPPRDAREPILTGLFIWRIGFVSIILMTGSFALFYWELRNGANIEQARTVAVNTLVTCEIFYLFNARFISASVLSREGLLGNPYVLVAIAALISLQLAFTYLGPFQALFKTAAIEPEVWPRILLMGISVLLLVELEKWVVRRRSG